MRAQTVLSMAVVAGLMGAWLVESPVVKAAPKSSQVTVANMHIDPGSGQYNLRPDAAGPTYVDYRVPGGDACVQGEIYPSSLASLVLNRPMPDGTRCSDSTGNPPRGFRVVFSHDGACWLLMNQAAPCDFLTPAGMPHVRGETVFKSRTSYSAMTFYFITQDGQGNRLDNYRLTTDQQAPIVVSLPNAKTVAYSGNATLAQHQGNPGGYVPVEFGIPLSFRITFDRVTVANP
jgi:hypothetical protein